jgi:hypothetical protein
MGQNVRASHEWVEWQGPSAGKTFVHPSERKHDDDDGDDGDDDDDDDDDDGDVELPAEMKRQRAMCAPDDVSQPQENEPQALGRTKRRGVRSREAMWRSWRAFCMGRSSSLYMYFMRRRMVRWMKAKKLRYTKE